MKARIESSRGIPNLLLPRMFHAASDLPVYVIEANKVSFREAKKLLARGASYIHYISPACLA